MYQHARTNRIIGWAMGAFALIVYIMTTAPTVAFWDNGEFIAVGYTLGIGHPPGSPLYTLICRLFSMLPFSNVARAVNFESLLMGALAIAFLYFSIAKMARRWERKVESFDDGMPTYIAGITACLLAAFSFSFWENALEAEVYATNIFIMAFTLWLTLRWSELSGAPRERKIIYLVGYILALGVGIHLGCLLWAPGFLVFMILFERSYLGTILLGLPALFGFILLSKSYNRGAYGLWLIFAVTVIYYALPNLWPDPPTARARKSKTTRGTPRGSMPSWLTATLLAVELVFVVVVGAAHGGSGLGWFLLLLAISLLSVYGFMRLARNGVIERPEVPARTIIALIALAVLALSVHAYLLIRARLRPAINESDPSTWGVVFDVMRRAQYEPMRLFPRRAPLPVQFGIVWDYFRIQFPILPERFSSFAWIPPYVLAAWGAICHARKDRRTFAMMATGFAFASLGLFMYMNISDHEVRTREYFWVPAYVGLAVWMGIGCGALVEWFRQLGRPWRITIAVALIAFSVQPLWMSYFRMDRSKNSVAYHYGRNMINFLEEDSILITNGDNDTFPLWYLQQVEGVRPDVDIVNLSLIQINWYIEQLKDRGLPMSFSYEQIAQMHPYWSRDPQTGELELVTLRDIAVHDIIRENNWERPIYFAVTVDDFMGYNDNLKLEGMSFRLVPETERHQIDEERTRENVFENYRYDSLVDVEDNWRVMDEIYKPATTRRLVTNYAAGFSRLGFKAVQREPADLDEAIRLYELGLKFAPDYSPSLNGLIAIYAVRLRQPKKALPYAERLVAARPESDDAWIRLGGVHLMIAERLDMQGVMDEATPHYESAAAAYEKVLARNPRHQELFGPMLTIYDRLGLQNKMDDILSKWERYDPEGLQRAIDISGAAIEQ